MKPYIYKGFLMIAIVWIAGFLSSFEIKWVTISAILSAIMCILLIVAWLVEGDGK